MTEKRKKVTIFEQKLLQYCSRTYCNSCSQIYCNSFSRNHCTSGSCLHLNIKDGKVTFIAKDYRDRAVKKPVTLDAVEFLRRFSMHILPQRFVKIRRFGIYNHTLKRNLELQFVPETKPDIDTLEKQQLKKAETSIERFERLTGFNPCRCQVCKTGHMITIRELPRIRSPGPLFSMTAIAY